MAIKAGQILHDVNGYVIDRIQTGGPGTLNIPEEKIYELGNYNSVAIVRDIPDLSFDLESVDVSTEFESVLLNKTPVWNGGSTLQFDFNNSVPIDVVSPFKSNKGAYDIVKGLVVPCLSLDRVTYRFGVRQNSTQSFTLRGDSIYYVPGVPHYEYFSYNGTNVSPITLLFNGSNGSAAIPYTEGSDTVYVLSVTLVSSTGAYKRLFHGVDYSDTATTFTLLATHTDYAGGTIRVTYASDATNTVYPQSGIPIGAPAGTNPPGQGATASVVSTHETHQGVSVKPAAVRGKDIDIYIKVPGATPAWSKFKGVQSAEVSRTVNLTNDEELGNHHYVAQDYLTPEVRGTLGVKPYDMVELWDQLEKITGVTSGEVIGPQLTQVVELKINVKHPDTGSVLKSIYCSDARFKVPGMQGRANQKVETSFEFTSDGGNLLVVDGSDTSWASTHS